MPNSAIPSESKMDRSYQSATLPDRRSRSMPPTNVIHLKKPEKEGFGFSMAFRLYVKDVKRKGTAHYAGLQRDHVIQKVTIVTKVVSIVFLLFRVLLTSLSISLSSTLLPR